MRLRRVLEEYFKLLKRIGVEIDHELAAEHISKQIGAGFTQSTKDGLPYSVKRRPSYEELLRRFEVLVEENQPPSAPSKSKSEVKNSISLLKPKEERINSASILNMPIVKSNDDNPSSEVNRSRLNLRQALSKVIIQSSNTEKTSPENAASAIKKKSSSNIAQIDSKKSISDSNSSSEESHERTPDLFSENCSIVADTQIAFMEQLGLCDKNYAKNIPRKSKRKRRCVQSIDKPDFLYGHIDFDVSFYSHFLISS